MSPFLFLSFDVILQKGVTVWIKSLWIPWKWCFFGDKKEIFKAVVRASCYHPRVFELASHGSSMMLLLWTQYCYLMNRWKSKSELFTNVICVLFLLYLPHSSSFVSVVFDFNPSLNIVVSVSPISSSVYLMGMEKSGLFMDAFCVFVILRERVQRVLCLISMHHLMTPPLFLQSFPLS